MSSAAVCSLYIILGLIIFMVQSRTLCPFNWYAYTYKPSSSEKSSNASNETYTKCYSFQTKKATYDDASGYCKKLNPKADLATPIDTEHDDFFKKIIKEHLPKSVDNSIFIGGKVAQDKIIDLHNRSRTKFPLTISSVKESCIVIQSNKDGEMLSQWQQDSCISRHAFICEMAAVQAEDCGNWFLKNIDGYNRCYMFYQMHVTVRKAEQICRSNKAHLPDLSSTDEWKLIYDAANLMAPNLIDPSLILGYEIHMERRTTVKEGDIFESFNENAVTTEVKYDSKEMLLKFVANKAGIENYCAILSLTPDVSSRFMNDGFYEAKANKTILEKTYPRGNVEASKCARYVEFFMCRRIPQKMDTIITPEDRIKSQKYAVPPNRDAK